MGVEHLLWYERSNTAELQGREVQPLVPVFGEEQSQTGAHVSTAEGRAITAGCIWKSWSGKISDKLRFL